MEEQTKKGKNGAMIIVIIVVASLIATYAGAVKIADEMEYRKCEKIVEKQWKTGEIEDEGEWIDCLDVVIKRAFSR